MGTLLQTLVLALGLLGYPVASAGQVELPTDISVHLTAQPDVGLIPGEPIVFTLTVVNIGPQPANDLSVISSDFYDQIDLGSGSADCQGVILSVTDGEPFHFNYTWYPTVFEGPLLVGESRTCRFTLALTSQAPPVWPFGFGLRTYLFEDINPANNTSTVILRRGDIAPVAIPMLSPTVTLLLALAMAASACYALRRSQSP